MKLLEIGCGNGRDACFFSEAGYRCVGIDISPQAVALAKAQRPKGNSARFRVADAEELPFADRLFDAVYSIGVLHSTRLERSLKEIFRVLKPGGIAMLHFWQKTMYLDRKKEKIHCAPVHLKEVLRGLPVRVLRFRSDIQGKHVDMDRRGANRHEHVAIIVLLQRPLSKKSRVRAFARSRLGTLRSGGVLGGDSGRVSRDSETDPSERTV